MSESLVVPVRRRAAAPVTPTSRTREGWRSDAKPVASAAVGSLIKKRRKRMRKKKHKKMLRRTRHQRK